MIKIIVIYNRSSSSLLLINENFPEQNLICTKRRQPLTFSLNNTKFSNVSTIFIYQLLFIHLSRIKHILDNKFKFDSLSRLCFGRPRRDVALAEESRGVILPLISRGSSSVCEICRKRFCRSFLKTRRNDSIKPPGLNNAPIRQFYCFEGGGGGEAVKLERCDSLSAKIRVD